MVDTGSDIGREVGRAAELDATHRALRRGSPLAVLLAVIVAIALRNSVEAGRLVPWVVAAFLTGCANGIFANRYVRANARGQRASQAPMLCSLLVWALVWGSLPLVVVPAGESGALLVFCSVLLLSLSTLNIVAVGASRWHTIAVETPLIAGLMVALLRSNDSVLEWLAVSAPLLLVALIGLHVELRSMVVGGAHLAARNRRLLADLQAEQAETSAASAQLALTNELLTRLVQIDTLTQVANRSSFMQRLADASEAARRHGRRLGVAYLDLDEFKAINDTYGHQVGDEVLIQVAARVNARARQHELLARIGGDEFVILLTEPGAASELQGFVDRVLGAFADPFEASGRTLVVTASLGVALSAAHDLEHPDAAETLLSRADEALYRAKRQGRNCAVITDSDEAETGSANGSVTSTGVRFDTQLMRVASEYSSSLFGIIEPDGTVRSASGSVQRLLGHSLDVVRGAHFTLVIAPYERQRVLEILSRLKPYDVITLDTWVLHCDGSEVPFDFTVRNLIKDPSVGGYLVSGQIARSLQVAREQAQFLATHDPATGLFTRSAALSEALALIAGAEHGQSVGVIQVDLDHLGVVNEVLGDHVGDEIVRLASMRIVDTAAPMDVVSRWDGDEFLIASVGLPDELRDLRNRVVDVLEPLYLVDGSEVAVEAKVAMVIGELDRPVDDLLSRVAAQLADLRMQRLSGSALPPPAVAERRLVVDQLQRAVEDGELASWFQPVVDGSGEIVGFEALLRWDHPTRGLTAPDTFLPLLSLAGLDARVDDMVLDQSVDFAQRLTAAGHDGVRVHVNVRPRQLSSAGFAGRLVARCTDAGLDPTRLGVEVTESDLLHVGPIALENLGALRRAGVHVAIDDFGTGFSSLSHLLELPVDALKIDRRFIARLETDPTSAGLTTAIIGLADTLGLGCVAEGVETRVQRDILIGMGKVLIQGHFYSPALIADAALELMDAAPWSRPTRLVEVADPEVSGARDSDVSDDTTRR